MSTHNQQKQRADKQYKVDTVNKQDTEGIAKDGGVSVHDYRYTQEYWTEQQQTLEAGLKEVKESGSRYDEGVFLSRLGNACCDLGQAGKAIGFHERALEINREIGNKRGEGRDLYNLGVACYTLGQAKKAIGFYERVLEIDREIGDKRNEGDDLGSLGRAYDKLGQSEKARELWREALAVYEKIKSPEAATVKGWLRGGRINPVLLQKFGMTEEEAYEEIRDTLGTDDMRHARRKVVIWLFFIGSVPGLLIGAVVNGLAGAAIGTLVGGSAVLLLAALRIKFLINKWLKPTIRN